VQEQKRRQSRLLLARANRRRSVHQMFAPRSDYELFNYNKSSIHSWSWNYRLLAPDFPSTRYSLMDLVCTHCNCETLIGFRIVIYCHCLPIRIGQFAHLLPSLDVFAVSQADSPESNSNSPYPSLPSQVTTLTTR